MFARGDLLELLNNLPHPPQRLRFLSPFDPLIRDRLRTSRMFNFDYRSAVVPARLAAVKAGGRMQLLENLRRKGWLPLPRND